MQHTTNLADLPTTIRMASDDPYKSPALSGTRLNLSEGARQQKQLQADLAGMKRLFELRGKLAPTQDLTAALHEIAVATADLAKTNRAVVYLAGKQNQRLELAAHHGYAQNSEFIENSRRRGCMDCCEKSLRSRERQVVENVESDPRWVGTEDRRVALAEGIRALQCTPITGRTSDLIGVLGAQFDRAHHPSEAELTLLDLLSLMVADFIEDRRAREALREREELLTKLADNLPDSAIYQYVRRPEEQVGRFTYFSAGLEKITGVKTEEALQDAMRLHRLIPKTELDRLLQEEARCVRELSDFHVEVPMRRTDGDLRWMSIRSRPRLQADGSVFWDGVQTDITGRKRAEQAQKRDEERFRLLFEHTPDAVFLTVPDGAIQAANPAACAMFGMSQAELIRGGRAALTQPGDPRVLAALEERNRKGHFHAELDYIRKNGERFTAEAHSVLLGGEPLQSFVILRDITERKRAEEALRASERRLRTFFESDMVGAIYWNMDGKITGANDKFLQMIGYSREEVVSGKVSWAEMTPPEYREKDVHAVEKLKNRGVDTPYEKEYIRKDGTRVPIIIGAAMLDERRYEGVAFVLDISDRKRAERDGEQLLVEVQESRAKFQTVVEHAPVGICVWRGANLVCELANPAYRALASGSQIIGKPFAEIWPEAAGTYGEIIRRVMVTGQPYSAADELVRIRRSPEAPLEEAYFNISFHRLEPDAFRGCGVLGVIMETTQQVQILAAMRQSEARQRFLLKLSDALRPVEQPAKTQQMAARVLGEHLDADRVAYFDVRGEDYIVERDYARSAPPIRGRFPVSEFGPRLLEAYQAGKTVVVHDVATDPGLSPKERQAYVDIQIGAHVGVPLVKGGLLVAGLAVHKQCPRTWSADEVALIEETAERTWSAMERAWAESALRESEQRYRTLFESIDEGFCVIQMLLDEQGNPADWLFLEVNPAFERHNGLVQAIGKTIREMVPQIEQRWFDIYGKVALTGEPIRFVEHSAALNRWFDLYAFRVGPPEQLKISVLFTDITGRKVAEEELARHRQGLERLVAERTARLQELVGELEHFSYTITHDLKAPLRAMRGFAEVASQMCETEARPFLNKISNAAERMDALIRDALNYSQAVRQELPLEDVDTGALLRGILDSYPQLQPWKAQIHVEGNMPVVMGNEAGLTQCFSNLLGNAVKFVRPGQMPEVRIRAEVLPGRSGWTRIWVEDKGIGIPEPMLPRVFDMFSRASKQYEGTGIGLALVRKVVQRMGGRVGVESGEGQGSRFWMELKGGSPHATRQIPSISAPARAAEGIVLYVEDEPGDVLFMEMAFRAKGFASALRVVGDGRGAIEYLSGAGVYADRSEYPIPGVMLLDLNLPLVTGFEVLQWMRNHPDYTRTPVIVFSSSTREDDRVKAREFGATDFIAKPGSGVDFGGIVEQLKTKWLPQPKLSSL